MQASSGTRSLWRPSPARLVRLLVGLWLFGGGEGLITNAELGNSPWTVLAEGVALNSPLSIGAATVIISFLVLLAWIPLRQRVGLGTLANAVIVGVALDVTLAWVPESSHVVVRGGEVLAGIGCVGIGSGLYINAALGPGPRDGLMTGLNRVTGRPLALVRMAIELSALTGGFTLGGTVGVGTVAFALLVGPAVSTGLALLPASATTSSS